jgi:type II secretory pathway component PulF
VALDAPGWAMANYEYHAEGPRGDPVLGHVTAPDEATARQDLDARGLKVIDLLWCPSVDESGMLRDDEAAMLIDSIGAAAANRLPVEITLAALAEESNDRRLAAAAQRLAARLQQGASIDEAVAELDRRIPIEVADMLRAGIESGDLAGTMERVTLERMETQRVRRRIQLAIAYPLVIVSILVPLLLFLCMYVIPMFADLYGEFNMNLPVMTEVIIQTAEQAPMLICGLLVLVFAIPLLLRVVGGRWLFHRVRAATPLVGQLWTWSGQREFASLLASFLKLRLPMTRAVMFTGDAISDRNIAHACRRVAGRLETGETLSTCLGKSIHFDRALVALVAWGERYGLLPEALAIAADLYEDYIEQHASLLRRLLPPITLIAVATLMFLMLVGLMIPLIQLIESLSM